jgi:Cof subfamily protein (haloacid dehalogenase superfamily)
VSIRLIAVDIDGTLLPSSGAPIGQRTCAALRAAEAHGLEIVIATGRRQAFAAPWIRSIGLRKNGVVISSNGAVTRRFDGALMERQFLPVEVARGLCGRMRGYGTLVFTFDREGPAADGSGALVIEDLKRSGGRLARWVEANRSQLTEITPIERAFDSGEAPIQGMLCGSVRQMKEAQARLLAGELGSQVSMHRTEYAAKDLSILDLLPLGCSKGTALERLARERGLDRQAIMAIGDNFNDVEMLDYAGRGVLMANADGEMLAMADERGWEQTGSCDDDGVAQVIEPLLRDAPYTSAGSSGADADSNHESAEREDKIAEWA